MTSHHLHQAGTAEAPQRGHTLGHFDTLRVRFIRIAVTPAPGEEQGPIQDLYYYCLPYLSRSGVCRRKKGGLVNETAARRRDRQWLDCCDIHYILRRNVFGLSGRALNAW